MPVRNALTTLSPTPYWVAVSVLSCVFVTSITVSLARVADPYGSVPFALILVLALPASTLARPNNQVLSVTLRRRTPGPQPAGIVPVGRPYFAPESLGQAWVTEQCANIGHVDSYSVGRAPGVFPHSRGLRAGAYRP